MPSVVSTLSSVTSTPLLKRTVVALRLTLLVIVLLGFI